MSKYVLPALPFELNALEPYIDARTMQIHHDKHHRAYVDKLNLALVDHPDLSEKTIEDLLSSPDRIPEEIRQAVINNGGGHANHSLFWQILGPEQGSEPTGDLKEKIKDSFSGFEKFKTDFTKNAADLFGSGWVWLIIKKGGILEIIKTSNQDNPLSLGKTPILNLDLWEHAYYLKYQNRRTEYINAWWSVINWEKVSGLASHF